ncbi:MAG: hypothetical protein ABIW76_11595, partial [Fibrobacteria bacterium]
QGALGSVFDQGDVAFDQATGQFRIHGHPTKTARVDGDPVPVFWTARALERLGYAVNGPSASDPADLRVTAWAAAKGGSAPLWECRLSLASGAATEESFASLEALVALLRA